MYVIYNDECYVEDSVMTRPGSWHSDQPLSRTADDRPVVINVGGIRYRVEGGNYQGIEIPHIHGSY